MEGILPVLTIPDRLCFSQIQHRQTLTIFNPYNFDVKYTLLTTNSKDYHVSTSEGYLPSQNKIDLVVRRCTFGKVSAEDQFLLQFLSSRETVELGRKILSVVYSYNPSDVKAARQKVDTVSTSTHYDAVSTAIPSGPPRDYFKVISLLIPIVALLFAFPFIHDPVVHSLVGFFAGMYTMWSWASFYTTRSKCFKLTQTVIIGDTPGHECFMVAMF